ncbi:SEC-C domain-containing protein [Micromonospora sp. NPDC047762]|uniref:SEC-C domain-containing protein n=1 Tax=Micromonospora sp. NPDC047762 TaxID=3364255 RepID=UPI00371FF97B
MDPLAKFGRNDPCWCGMSKKYKDCHGGLRARSMPGEPIGKDDDEDWIWLSPTTRVARGGMHVPPDGVAITIPTGRPNARPVEVPPAIRALLAAPAPVATLPLTVLGKHRFDLYDHTERDRDALAESVAGIAVAVMDALSALSRLPEPHPTVLWNDEVDPGRLVGQALLFADHVCVPDRVFAALVTGRDDDTVREAITQQRQLRPLIEAGLVVPVPKALGVAAQATAVNALTERDLRRRDLTDWVRTQMLVEGPTAREAMFITAIDDLERWPHMWMYSRHNQVQTGPAGDTTFTSRLFGTYDPTHDYGPWREQNLDKAVGAYLRRANERLVTGEVFTAGYFTTSPFQARLLARKGALPDQPAQAAVWADIPILPAADPATLARAAAEEEAVEDLRHRVRSAMHGARDLGTRADALTRLGEDLAHASRQLERTIRTERRWNVIAPVLGGIATIALGAAGGPAGIAAGALGTATSLAPYFATRTNRRRNAAYLFYLASRSRS